MADQHPTWRTSIQHLALPSNFIELGPPSRPLVAQVWFSIADRDLELWAKSFAVAHKWDVAVKELEVPVLAVQGPKSTEMLSSIFGAEFMEDIKFYNFKEVCSRPHNCKQILVYRATLLKI